MELETVNSRRRGLYQLGGIAAFIIAALLIGEIVVYATLPRASTALEHFTIFQDNWLAGLLTFDLLGMVSYLLFVPTILALYLILRRKSRIRDARSNGLLLYRNYRFLRHEHRFLHAYPQPALRCRANRQRRRRCFWRLARRC